MLFFDLRKVHLLTLRDSSGLASHGFRQQRSDTIVSANRLRRAAFQSFLAKIEFFRCAWLSIDHGRTDLIVTVKEVRGMASAVVTVNAGAVHEEAARGVFRESVVDGCHNVGVGFDADLLHQVCCVKFINITVYCK